MCRRIMDSFECNQVGAILSVACKDTYKCMNEIQYLKDFASQV